MKVHFCMEFGVEMNILGHRNLRSSKPQSLWSDTVPVHPESRPGTRGKSCPCPMVLRLRLEVSEVRAWAHMKPCPLMHVAVDGGSTGALAGAAVWSTHVLKGTPGHMERSHVKPGSKGQYPSGEGWALLCILWPSLGHDTASFALQLQRPPGFS